MKLYQLLYGYKQQINKKYNAFCKFSKHLNISCLRNNNIYLSNINYRLS